MKTRDVNRCLVLGCGTGRCGTVSLAKFLNCHQHVSVLHEGAASERTHHVVPWYNGENQLWSWLSELESVRGDARWYGDVGPYFLPYIPLILEKYPTARIICLERHRKEVIKSYLNKTMGRNHWYRHGGIGWQEDAEWDPAFPKYDEPDKSMALGLYWDQYHCAAMEYRARFAENFMLLPTDALNSSDGRRKILDFIDYDGPGMFDGDFRDNKTYRSRLRRSFSRFLGLD